MAVQGLRQPAGRETVRVAILGVASGPNSRGSSRKVLKTLLTDPLSDIQDWEAKLDDLDTGRPLIVRVGPIERSDAQLETTQESSSNELHISSAEFNDLNLEILLMDVRAPYGTPGSVSVNSLEEAVLSPVVDISATNNQTSMVKTPVHQAMLVGEGLMGAANVSMLPVLESSDAIVAAVDFQGMSTAQQDVNFTIIDTALAEESIRLFRQGPQHAMEYERGWSTSNLSSLVSWLKAGAKVTDDTTKPAVRKLISSVLQNIQVSIENEGTRSGVSKLSSSESGSPKLKTLQEGLAGWSGSAHSELQGQLDLAFTGSRWRKLGWWKLFWRVDDVGMLTNEMLSQRFLPTAEQELVYLTGRIAELQGGPAQYPQPSSSLESDASTSTASPVQNKPVIATKPQSNLPKWPGHIAFTRRYLQNETVPALQSLAQKLVIQSIATSSISGSLAAMLYISSFSSSVYEAGAVVALGVVYSLGRMQKKWEAGRTFWEGEVREEGRKAVRAVEESAAQVLHGRVVGKDLGQSTDELDKARELVARAEDALARMK